MICPCGGEQELLTDTPVGHVLRCTQCSRAIPAAAHNTPTVPTGRPQQMKLSVDPGPAHNAVEELEEPVMQRILAALRRAGYEVLCTVHRHSRHTCSKCGHNEWHHGGYGADPGVPDLLVRQPGTAVWLAMEIKGTKTALRPAQKRLAEAGAIVVVRSEAEALAVVGQYDEKAG